MNYDESLLNSCSFMLGFYMYLVPANRGHLKIGPWIR